VRRSSVVIGVGIGVNGDVVLEQSFEELGNDDEVTQLRLDSAPPLGATPT
jgi:hypothetical protein